jgi:hypothetical protein
VCVCVDGCQFACLLVKSIDVVVVVVTGVGQRQHYHQGYTRYGTKSQEY